jgi:iron(III) transport system substrate-binding protein
MIRGSRTSVVLALVGCWLFVACGASGGAPAPATGATGGQGASKPVASGPAPSSPAGSPATAANDALQSLYEAARAEGEVVFWGPADPEELQPVADAFMKRFPGVKVTHFEIRGEEFVPRAIAEAPQGRASFDVGEGRMTVLSPLLQRDLVQGYSDWADTFKSVELSPNAITENGRLLTWYSLLYPIAYNTNLVRAQDAPKSWDDLLDPKWRGRMIVEPRAAAFGYLGLEWGPERLGSYMEQLRTQQPVFVQGGTTVATQLVAGVAPIAVGTYAHKVLQLQQQGAPIDWAKEVSPQGATRTALFALKGAPHPNAAKLFVGYLTSNEAQRIYATHVQNGPLYPGAVGPTREAADKNNIKVLLEGSENFEQAEQLANLAQQRLGTAR